MKNNCPGIYSENAGKADACNDCPNKNQCLNKETDPDLDYIKKRFKTFKIIICVMCGKGGVGKSFFSVVLSQYLSKIYKVMLLDFDIFGSSIPRLTNTIDYFVTNINEQFEPIKVNNLSVISIGHLENNMSNIYDTSIKDYFIKKILKNCNISDEEILIVDTPPNISEEHFAIYKYFNPCNSILISTPHIVSILDMNRQFSFCQKAQINILGVISNMGKIECNHCGYINSLFLKNEIVNFCKEKKIIFLGEINFNNNWTKKLDNGEDIESNQINLICDKIINIINERKIF